MINAGRGRYAPLTILPMLFVISTTLTAGYQMITGPFAAMIADGWKLGGLNAKLIQGIAQHRLHGARDRLDDRDPVASRDALARACAPMLASV